MRWHKAKGCRAAAGRLLVVTRHYAPEPVGSGPVIQELAEWFACQGRQTEVLSVRPSYPGSAIMTGYERGQHDRAVEAGVLVRRLPTWPVKPSGVLARIAPEIQFLFNVIVRRVCGRIKPSRNVISLCPSILSVTAALALKQPGGRHIALVHDIPSGLAAMLGVRSRALIALLRRIEIWTLNRTDHIVVLSSAMAAALRRMGVRTPISILPPSLDTSALRPLTRPAGMPPTLLYSGSLGRKQGLDQLLDTAAILRKKAPAIRIVIRGDGPNRDNLMSRAIREGLQNVCFQPLVSKDVLEKSLSEGDIHLVPQIGQGGDFAVPSKVFAIMAAGRPFIATADRGSCLAELSEASGAGIVVPPDNAEAFADMVLALIDDPRMQQEMGRSGRRYVEACADTEVVMAAIADLLAEGSERDQTADGFTVRDRPCSPVKRSEAIQ